MRVRVHAIKVLLLGGLSISLIGTWCALRDKTKQASSKPKCGCPLTHCWNLHMHLYREYLRHPEGIVEEASMLPVVKLLISKRNAVQAKLHDWSVSESQTAILLEARMRLNMQLAVYYRVKRDLQRALGLLVEDVPSLQKLMPTEDAQDMQTEFVYDLALTLWRMQRASDALLILRCWMDVSAGGGGRMRLLALEKSINSSESAAAAEDHRCIPCATASGQMLSPCPTGNATSRIDHVITLYNEAFFDNSGVPAAAMGLADYWNASFTSILVTGAATVISQYRKALEQPNTAIVLMAALGNEMPVSELGPVKHASSILLCFGTDTLYAQQHGALCEFDGCRSCDLYLDQMDGVVGHLLQNGMQATPWIWTPSAALWAILESQVVVSANGSYAFARDVLGTRGKRVALFSLNSEYRQHVRESLRDMDPPLEMIDTQQSLAPEAVFELYSQAFITLSTTAVSPEFLPSRCRCVKGIWDWIAPSLGSFLITDDHPDNVRKYGPHVFYYRFGDMENMKEVIQSVWKELKDNSDKTGRLLREQRAWVLNNLLDVQLKYAVHQILQGEKKHACLSRPVEAGWLLPESGYSQSCVQ